MTPEPLAFIATADLAGLLRGKSIPVAELPKRMGCGVGIAPSNLMLSVFGPIHDTPFGTAGDLMLARIIHEKCAIKAKPLLSLTTMRMGCLMKFFAMKSLAQVFGGLGRFRAVR